MLIPESLVVGAFAPVAVWVTASELKRFEIPNIAALATLFIFLIFAIDHRTSADIALHLFASIGLGLASFLLWKLGKIGGGDVKFLAATSLLIDLALWPTAALVLFGWSVVTAGVLGISTLSQNSVRTAVQLPFGIPVSFTVLTCLLVF